MHRYKVQSGDMTKFVETPFPCTPMHAMTQAILRTIANGEKPSLGMLGSVTEGHKKGNRFVYLGERTFYVPMMKCLEDMGRLQKSV